MSFRLFSFVCALSIMMWSPIVSQAETMRLAVTTSFNNSGLSDVLLPALTAETGIKVEMLVVGTGQALRLGRAGDVDAILVHSRAAEEAFVAEGFGTQRHDLMYNDFVIVGPATDPAGVAGLQDVGAALRQIAGSGALFASRGDDSGTHKKEMQLWQAAGLDPTGDSGSWYRETGSGMGATLNTAIGMGAYVMTDRATWISFGNKQDYAISVQGDAALFNQYGVIPVSPQACPSVQTASAQVFVDWLISQPGQAAIAAYRVAGQQLFFPNAAPE